MTPPSIVLGYHALGTPEPSDFARAVVTPPARFEEHVALLRGRGYRFVPAGELMSRWTGAEPPPGLVALTFDDGWRSDLTLTAPLLERLGVPGTFFLAPGLFGNTDERLGDGGQILTEDEARQLAALGVELGAHTMYHPDVRAVDRDALAAELTESKRRVEDLSGRPCDLLAWPLGLSDEAARQVARDVGFRGAFAFSSGPWRTYAVPRLAAGLLAAADVPRYLDMYADRARAQYAEK